MTSSTRMDLEVVHKSNLVQKAVRLRQNQVGYPDGSCHEMRWITSQSFTNKKVHKTLLQVDSLEAGVITSILLPDHFKAEDIKEC